MKTIVLILVLLFSAPMQDNDVYHIIKIKGKIFNVTTNQLVKPGDKIKASDQLEFSSEDALALVISEQKGKFTLRMPEKDLFGDDELLAMADAAASPIQSRSQLATRTFGQAGIKDLDEYFGNQYFNVIGNELTIKLNKEQYPLDDNNYFTFDFMTDNDEHSVKVRDDQQQLIINKSDIMEKIPGTPKDTIHDVAVYKYDLARKSLVNVSNMHLAFVNPQMLKKEFKVIIDMLEKKNMDAKAVNKYLASYFIDVYGKTDIVALNDFIYSINPVE